jgi:hypothetical protein
LVTRKQDREGKISICQINLVAHRWDEYEKKEPAEMLKLSQLLRAYAWVYGAGLLSSAHPRMNPACAKKCKSVVVNYLYDGQLLQFPLKSKELHLRPIFIKEGTDKKELLTEIKWKDGEPLAKIARNTFGSSLVVKKEAESSADSLMDKYPEPKIDLPLKEREKKLLRQIEEKQRLGAVGN